MLKELHIQDFAIIDELHLTLEPGFNILTGETGAGKSILIDAVILLIGGRADTTSLREGCDRARVEGMFVLSPDTQQMIAPLLEQEALEGDTPDVLWLARELRSNGRTIARVNGRAVSLALMREIAEGLIDVHGQSEHLSLFRLSEHLTLLDRFGGLEEFRAEVRGVVSDIRKVRAELSRLRQSERERMQRIDLLRFQIEEIHAARPTPGELEELEADLIRLNNAEQLSSLAASLMALLEDGADQAPAVLDLLGRGQRSLSSLSRIDVTVEPQLRGLESAVYQIEDIARALRDYAERIEFNPRRLASVEERVIMLRQLTRKYGGSLADVLAYADHAAEELETLEHSDERIAELEQQEAELMRTCADHCLSLSQKRKAAASKLIQGMESELNDLKMAGARLGVAFTWAPDDAGIQVSAGAAQEVVISAEGEAPADATPVLQAAFDTTGIDRVEFLVAPNVGEGLKPLARIASGGETARLMLALKTVLSRADRTPTLIFDEIDQGIGGRTGAVVGAKLWQLTTAANHRDAIRHQVLCITHLPQLAGFGDIHYRVSKHVVDGRTTTHVDPLAGEDERAAELASMLGTQGEAAYRGALEILQQSQTIKQRGKVS